MERKPQILFSHFFYSFVVSMIWKIPISMAGMCPMCKNTLGSAGRQGLLDGFYWSILLIAGVPLVIMAIAGVVVYKIWKIEKKTYL